MMITHVPTASTVLSPRSRASSILTDNRHKYATGAVQSKPLNRKSSGDGKKQLAMERELRLFELRLSAFDCSTVLDSMGVM